jgi:hypothetical protein
MNSQRPVLTALLFLIFLLPPSDHSSGEQLATVKPEPFRIMFYNLENLFDPFDDTLKNDEEYVAGGLRGWSWKRFERKLQNTSKVIISAGGWRPPEIIGFCEVENRFALVQLLKRTPLERFEYRIIHYESPDPRGIDVGMIYRSDRFKPIYDRAIPLIYSGDSVARTRDILYVKGIADGIDTLHLFINHWPSKFGGAVATISRRRDAALLLKSMVDSIASADPQALVILAGDFNDEPQDESVAEHLGAKHSIPDEQGFYLYNLMAGMTGKWDTGSHKYREEWSIIDQFIVSSPFLQHRSGFRLRDGDARILKLPFLLEEDLMFNGTKPFRTFNGIRYLGGFSDHLPILLTLCRD